jgi:phage terminase small subunit
MPTHQRFGSNNHENRKDRRKPAIELNEEPAVVVREMSAALQLTPQDRQLMSERGILSLQPDLRLEG